MLETCPTCGNVSPFTIQQIKEYKEFPTWIVPLYPITGMEVVDKSQYAVISAERIPEDEDLVIVGGLFGVIIWRLSQYGAKWIAYPISQ